MWAPPPSAYDELPAGADGVVICTPPAQHASQVLAAVERGAGVLVEKPLCTTLADADKLVAAHEAGAQIAYAENLVYAPAVQLALAHAAQLECIDVIDVRCVQSRPTWGDFLTEGWDGGVLFDLGVHPLAVALLMAAPARPVEVRAVLEGRPTTTRSTNTPSPPSSSTPAPRPGSWPAGGDRPAAWDAQAACPDGVVRLELLPQVSVERNGVEVRLPDLPEGVPAALVELGYLAQMQQFAADLEEERLPDLGPAFGRSVLDLTCAAYASAGQDGEWVDLPFAGPRNQTPIQLWRR